MANKIKFNPELEKIYQKYNELVFRMSLQHMIMVGSNSFDDENVKEACEKIDLEEKQAKEEGVILVMTPEFQKKIVFCAQAISKIPTWDVLYFVKKKIHISPN